jgi:hypothetical protein
VPSSIVDKPLNPSFTTATRVPTVPVNEADVVPVKHNFAEVFDRPRFSGTYERVIKHRNTRVRYDDSGKIRNERLPREKVGPNPAFVKKHKLTIHSHPADFAEVFVPYQKNPYDGADEHPSFQALANYTNSKAIMLQAGKGGAVYPDFKPFAMHEIRQHLGLYVLNGLNPSPRVELKFRSSAQDELHGSDFVRNSFGPGAERRHRMFKTFFAAQNPMIEAPPWKKKPSRPCMSSSGPSELPFEKDKISDLLKLTDKKDEELGARIEKLTIAKQQDQPFSMSKMHKVKFEDIFELGDKIHRGSSAIVK